MIMSPTFSFGSNFKLGLLMTIFEEYNPGAILMIEFGSALSIAS